MAKPPSRDGQIDDSTLDASTASAAEADTNDVSNEPSDGDSSIYKVGYCRPPLETRFKPGQKANPNGRPKHALNLKTLLENGLNEKVTVLEGGKPKRMSKAQIGITKAINNFAQKGDVKSLALFLEKLSPPEPASGGEGQSEEEATTGPTEAAILQLLRAKFQGTDE
jgi:hypothetical protein